MNTAVRRRLAIAITALSLACVSNVAASGGGYVADGYAPRQYALSQRILSTVQGIVPAIQDARDRIVDAIFSSTGTQTEALTNAITKGSELGSQTTRRTEVELERARRDAALEQANGCSVTARSKSGGAGRSAQASGGSYGAGGAPVPLSGQATVSKEMAKAIDVANGLAPAPSTNKQVEVAAKGMCESFGQGNQVRELLCRAAGWLVGNLTGFPQADVRGETLFDGPQASLEATGFEHARTLGSSKAEREAVAAYIFNLEKPQQIEDPKSLDMKTREGKGFVAMKGAFDARLSLGSKPMRDYLGNRSADKATIPMLQQLTKDPATGQWVQDYLRDRAPNWETEGISVEEMEFLEVERRYLNPAWYLDFASQFDPAVIQREALYVALAGQELQVKALQEARKENMLLGQIYNSLVRVEMRDAMDSIRQQAKSSATAVE